MMTVSKDGVIVIRNPHIEEMQAPLNDESPL